MPVCLLSALYRSISCNLMAFVYRNCQRGDAEVIVDLARNAGYNTMLRLWMMFS